MHTKQSAADKWHTFTLQTLLQKPIQQRPTVITEGKPFVVMCLKPMRNINSKTSAGDLRHINTSHQHHLERQSSFSTHHIRSQGS